MKQPHSAVFLDHSTSRIFRTVDRLRDAGWDVRVITDENDLVSILQASKPDVLLINLDMQPNDAIAVLSGIRSQDLPQPYIVIYSDKQDDFVHELAYNAGADAFVDYHSKPALMIMFLKNLVRRRGTAAPPQGALFVDPEKYLVFMNGQPIRLPRMEFRILEMMFNHRGGFLTKNEIAEALWHDIHVASRRTIDVHIYNMRRLLGKNIIQSQKGKGYRIRG